MAVSCSRKTFIGTLNVRTVREQYKRIELASLFLESRVSVLGVQEHQIVHEERGVDQVPEFCKGSAPGDHTCLEKHPTSCYWWSWVYADQAGLQSSESHEIVWEAKFLHIL